MPDDLSSVLRRVTSILDCFSASQPRLGVREVARLSGLSASTAGRLMAEMKDLGLLQQNSATRMYSLGSKILEWSGVYTDGLDFRNVALPFMEGLRTSTSETISLYLLEGDERLCVERMESYHSLRMTSRVGHRLPLYAGSAGKSILAFLPERRIEEILQKTVMEPFTPLTITDPSRLRAELAQIRQAGYAVSQGEWISEASGVAAPIFSQNGEVMGAISISGPSSRFDPVKLDQYAVEVTRAAGQISRMMGFVDTGGTVE